MPEIIRCLPSFVNILQLSSIGLQAPGLEVSAGGAWPAQSRIWGPEERAEYVLKTGPMTSAELHELEMFFEQVGGGVFGVIEEESKTHYNLSCGPLGDGSQTTFMIPVYTPSDITVFVDGVPQASGYTIHPSANTIGSEGRATAGSLAEIVTQWGNEAIAVGISPVDTQSIEVTPTGGNYPQSGTNTPAQSNATAGEEYTGVGAVLETASPDEDQKIYIRWYDSLSANVGSSYSDPVTVKAGAWRILTVTGTCPPTAIKGRVVLYRDDTVNTDRFYVGAFAFCGGDYDNWHLPSRAPGLVEFATAPAAGSRVTVTATGYRYALCTAQRPPSWSVDGGGRIRLSDMRVTERVEY